MTLPRLLATWFGAGLLPRAPGTWGSIAALPFAWVILWAGGWPALLVASVLVFFIGWWAAQKLVDETGLADPQLVVIDEVAGQWLVLLPAGLHWWSFLLALILFRIADIKKPWPANWADSQVPGGLGVMLDDVFAALYGLVVMLIVHHFVG